MNEIIKKIIKSKGIIIEQEIIKKIIKWMNEIIILK